jgi:hypothetical protein
MNLPGTAAVPVPLAYRDPFTASLPDQPRHHVPGQAPAVRLCPWRAHIVIMAALAAPDHRISATMPPAEAARRANSVVPGKRHRIIQTSRKPGPYVYGSYRDRIDRLWPGDWRSPGVAPVHDGRRALCGGWPGRRGAARVLVSPWTVDIFLRGGPLVPTGTSRRFGLCL